MVGGGEKRAMKNVAYEAADKEVVVQHFRLFFTLRANMACHRNCNTVQSLWQVNEIPSLCLVNEIPPCHGCNLITMACRVTCYN